MFDSKSKIDELMNCLTERRVSLYHACHAIDFSSYLELAGVPSRSLLLKNGLPFTSFDTDEQDKQNGVWGSVFANLNDFRNFFHSGSNSVPSPYGPILIVIDPKALLDCKDIAVCLRSAGARDFNRNEESLNSISEIDSLFDGERGSIKGGYFKKREELKKLFPYFKAYPEISCNISAEHIGVEHFTKILVDPIEFKGQKLTNWVHSFASDKDETLASLVKQHGSKRSEELNQIIDAIATGVSDLKSLTAKPDLKEWAEKCLTNGIDYQFSRYARYLREGTLTQLEKLSQVAS
jgi:hypothetical protein